MECGDRVILVAKYAMCKLQVINVALLLEFQGAQCMSIWHEVRSCCRAPADCLQFVRWAGNFSTAVAVSGHRDALDGSFAAHLHGAAEL